MLYFLYIHVTYFSLQTPHGPVRYCFTSEVVICWCSYLSSLPTAAFLSVRWTMKYFKTQGPGRQAAACLLFCTLSPYSHPSVGLPTRVWYMCIPLPARQLLILASLCCLGRCMWQSMFPSSRSWVGNAKRALFKMLQELLNDKAALRHRCACHGWPGLICLVMREVQACVAVTGGLHRAAWYGFFFALNYFCKIYPHW